MQDCNLVLDQEIVTTAEFTIGDVFSVNFGIKKKKTWLLLIQYFDLIFAYHQLNSRSCINPNKKDRNAKVHNKRMEVEINAGFRH